MNIKLLLLFPIIEIFIFVLFGDLFGFLNVIFWIILSGFIGFWLFIPKVNNLQNIKNLNAPIDWICKRVSGLLLIIPGFATDFIGILLLIKLFRSIIWNLLPKSFKDFSHTFDYKTPSQEKKDKNIIDAEYKNLDE